MANRFVVYVDDVEQKEIKLEADLAGLPEGDHVIKVESYQDTELLGSDTRNITVPSSGGGTPTSLYGDAAGGWSFRKLNPDYTGAAIRVRLGGDTVEQDIGFDANGELDIAALNTFLSGGSGWISVVYDQFGSNDMVQTETGAQAPIIDSGSSTPYTVNGKPVTQGAADWYTLGTGAVGSTGLFADANEEYAVLNVFAAESTASGTLFSKATTDVKPLQIALADGSANIYVRGEANSVQIPKTADTPMILMNDWDGSDARFSIDGGTPQTLQVGTEAEVSQDINVFSRTDGSHILDGKFGELIIWDKTKIQNSTDIINDVKSYWGV